MFEKSVILPHFSPQVWLEVRSYLVEKRTKSGTNLKNTNDTYMFADAASLHVCFCRLFNLTNDCCTECACSFEFFCLICGFKCYCVYQATKNCVTNSRVYVCQQIEYEGTRMQRF